MSPSPLSHRCRVFVLALLIATVLVLSSTGRQVTQDGRPVEGTGSVKGVSTGVAVPFIANLGQADERVAFLAHTFGGVVSVTSGGEIVYSLPVRGPAPGGVVICETFLGGWQPDIEGRLAAGARVSSFRGRDRRGWLTGIPAYREVTLGKVYPGIEVTLRAHGGNVEKVFHVGTGHDPASIRIAVEGADCLSTTEDGRLMAETAKGPVTFTRPVAYQAAGCGLDYVEVAYAVSGKTYGFTLGSYDPSRPLVIDPMLASTYLGGSEGDGQFETPMALSGDGYVYVANRTKSSDFPVTPGVYDTLLSGGSDAYVAKLDAGLTTVVAATYLGGGGNEGGWPGLDLCLDGEGNVCVIGQAKSADFPTTPGAYDSTNAGSGDCFIAILTADLDSILAATLLGGSDEEALMSIAIGPDGDVFGTAGTRSGDFPYVSGCYDTSYAGGFRDVVIFRLDSGLTTLKASTFLGVSGYDAPEVITVDGAGDIYITGWTASPLFPTTPGAYAETYQGGMYDAFVTKVNPGLTTILASTFLGGARWDFGYYLKLGPDGRVYVTGHTASRGTFPYSPGAFDSTYNGVGIEGVDDDAFVSVFDAGLTTLLASTYLGGSEWENGEAIDVDGEGNIYVAGWTRSPDFRTTSEAFDRIYSETPHSAAGDVFITRFNSDLTEATASTFLGGGNVESVGDILLDGQGRLYISGGTSSTDFPVTPAAYDTTFNGGVSIGGDEDRGGDVFIAAMDTLLSEAEASVERGEGGVEALGAAFPNPFRASTAIGFSIAREAEGRIAVYDVKGALVRWLLEARLTPGDHTVTWDGCDAAGRPVAGGIYFCRLETGSRAEACKLVYMR